MPIAIVIGAAVLAGVVIVLGILSVRSERDLVEERLATLSANQEEFKLELQGYEEEVKPTQKGVLAGVDRAIASREWAQKWRQQLSRADLKLTVAEYAATHVISMAGFFALSFFVIFRGQIVYAILAAFIGLFAPRLYVARMVSQRLIKFENQLADTLSLWVNALRSGYSVLQAMEAIARDSPEPTKTEFARVVQEVQLGIEMEDAFEHMLARVESEDLDLVVTAVNIQREVGGNLAEILDVIGHTVRERIKLKGEIRVLTAQGRYTGYLISFLPIVLAVFLSFVSPTFMEPMLRNRMCGWPMIGVGLALIGLGTAAIQKIVDIEI